MDFLKELIGLMPDQFWAWGPGIVILLGMYLMVRSATRGLAQIGAVALDRFLTAQDKQAEAICKLAVCIEASSTESESAFRSLDASISVLHRDMQAVLRRLPEKEEK